VAARLQSAANISQILITEDSFNKVSESFICSRIGEMSFKNKEFPLIVYEVLS
jgi:class 3 adenylate cyclase